MPSDLELPSLPQSTDDITELGLSSFAPYLMNRILRRYNARMDEEIRGHGLNVPRLRVLAALAAEGPQTINNLAVFAISEQSSISRLLDQMEAEGLVLRQVSESDSRARIASLTELGRDRFEEAFPLMRGAEADMLTGFSTAERALLIELLRRMMSNIRQNPI
ncbi:MarR family transcriptional regulator [Rhodophyticola sp. CCM32]|nr:MarR family transcriptional regulator [Rhodophyticola sp. CCM32]